MRRRRQPGGAAVPSRQHPVDILRCVSTQTCFDKRADHDPHHVPKKSSSLATHDHAPITFGNIAGQNRSHRRFFTMTRARKAGEIMRAEKSVCRALHSLNIQWPPPMPRHIRKQHRPIIRIPDLILISLGNSRCNRVEFIGDHRDLPDQNVPGKPGVNSIPQSVDRDLRLIRIKMRDLPLGMHAGIGSRRTDKIHRVTHDFAHDA